MTMWINKKLRAIVSKVYSSDRFKLPRQVMHKIHYENPRFTSNAEMALYVDEWIKTFDIQYDLIVGVPRSGLLIASLIATQLARPLATPDNSLWVSKSISPKPIRQILVIDDCISTGKSINAAAESMREQYPQAKVHTGVLFANDNNKGMVDSYFMIINGYQLFQWNMMHYKMGPVGFDLDGVICESSPNLRNEEKYLEFLAHARPYLIPEFEIDYIITSRLEKYRPQTEKWLKQAEQIWSATKIPCLSIDELRIID